MPRGGKREGSGRKVGSTFVPNPKPTRSFCVDPDHLEMVDSPELLGFKNRSALINQALQLLKESLK
jgi:hypothetical protein